MNCADHPGKELDIYCLTCGCMICYACQFGAHKGHDVELASNMSFINETTFDYKADIESQLSDLRLHAEGVETLARSVADNIDYIEEEENCDDEDTTAAEASTLATARRNVNAAFDQIHAVVTAKIEDRRSYLLEKLDELSHSKLDLLRDHLDTLNNTLGEIWGHISSGDEFLEAFNSGDHEMLNNKGVILVSELKDIVPRAKRAYTDESGDLLKPVCDTSMKLALGDGTVLSYRPASAENMVDVIAEISFDLQASPLLQLINNYGFVVSPTSAQDQYNLGQSLVTGVGNFGENKERGVEMFHLAADQGSCGAQYKLGVCYEGGIGVKQNSIEAVKWYEFAAAKEDMRAQFKLGEMYYYGDGVAEDKAEAARLFLLSAKQEFAKAQYYIGRCYFNGEGVKRDDCEAAGWYELSAKQGFDVGQYNLGLCFFYGDGVTTDKVEALSWLRMAADQGNLAAQHKLGNCYDLGLGVEENKKEAVRWFRLAAEHGFANAQNNLGVCYDTGDGLPQDKVEAVSWFRLAADQGNLSAQFNLGNCYESGEGGIDKDMNQAICWYSKAAESGFSDAQCHLGFCYLNGLGVEKDKVQAAHWLRLARDQGDRNAQSYLERISRMYAI